MEKKMEPELDANSALTELDKGLRSVKPGEQCEAIVRFPILFEKYPFPILINSAFLKLADVFRMGTNFLRFWVLRVCQQSERHLDKILSVDEFIGRIFSVIHSNDPIARALTLRTLGSLSILIPERKHVHHSIRVGLDSNDRVEVYAAIYAATCFAKRSKTFATTMCTKVSSMVKSLSTPIDLKRRLVPIFQHMHHDVAVAATVRKLCKQLMIQYPTKEFVTTTLHSLTLLAAATISNLKEQVFFLLHYLQDPRAMVKFCVLIDLKFLGKKGGHLWEADDITNLIKIVTRTNSIKQEKGDDSELTPTENEKMINYTLDVINSLTSSSAIVNCIKRPDSELKNFLEIHIQSTNIVLALKAIQIATSIAVNWKKESLLTGPENLIEMTSIGITSVLETLKAKAASRMDERQAQEFYTDWDKCLSFGVSLCKASPSKCSWFCSGMINLLNRGAFPVRTRNSISQAIAAVGSDKPDELQKILPEVLIFLENLTPEQIYQENSTVIHLVTVVLQAHQRYILGNTVIEIINKILQNFNLWDRYRIARNSFRYGQTAVAVRALDGTASKVATETYYFWLSALSCIAQAEATLTDVAGVPKLQARLTQANIYYLQAVTSLRAATSPTYSMQFPIEYVRIRSEMLGFFLSFLSACEALQFSPPPAIAPTIGSVSRDELLKCGRVVTQLRKSIRDFQTVAEMYGRLYQTAFDADNETLLNIQILQHFCSLVSREIEKLVVPKDHPTFSNRDDTFNFSTESCYPTLHLLITSYNEAVNVLQQLKNFPNNTITQEHLECIKEAVRILVETPLSYPRFFFQNLQNTKVKIAVSPQPRVPGENVSILFGNNLALKVEGVIQQSGGKGGPQFSETFQHFKKPRGVPNASKASKAVQSFRKPKAIRITVVSTPTANPRAHIVDVNKMNQEPTTIVKDVSPHKDFFTAQFLLGSWPSGLYTVNVDTSLVDYDGRVWMTGPRATLGIRVLQDIASSGASADSNKVITQTNISNRPSPSGTPHLVPAGSISNQRY